ncbi:hypothetical protein ACHHYP_03717 [Achlya hypogyna]|uniref:Uncharacterized protein n=1 Tax=Achlya hypogyna TaxID=1202772 RepID=A0A1V9Z3E9_ACHHY|nr:hypothetical protein ACHHYP_03717 [Achlya hypogyna]
MGNDGGVIAVKRKFMRHGQKKQRDEQADQKALREKRTTLCALTDEPLAEPIVADKLGNLFNKVALLERLLDRTLPEQFGYIRSMKDVAGCKFYRDEAGAFHCPITMQIFNGKHPFVVLKKCGCVLSEKALKEVKSKECLMCGAPSREKDRWPLLLDHDKAADVMLTLHRDDDKTAVAKRKRDDDADAASIVVAPPKSKLRAVNEALDAVKAEKEKSAVFASLFSNEKTSQKSAKDLLMTVGGMRYTLS